jgi:t-SNARE complex subunit (syntaxin)
MAKTPSGPWPDADPEVLQEMTNEELIILASRWTQHTKYEMELQRRANEGQLELTSAIREFKRAADKSSMWLLILTVLLVVLTVVIAVLTVVLAVNPHN